MTSKRHGSKAPNRDYWASKAVSEVWYNHDQPAAIFDGAVKRARRIVSDKNLCAARAAVVEAAISDATAKREALV